MGVYVLTTDDNGNPRQLFDWARAIVSRHVTAAEQTALSLIEAGQIEEAELWAFLATYLQTALVDGSAAGRLAEFDQRHPNSTMGQPLRIPGRFDAVVGVPRRTVLNHLNSMYRTHPPTFRRPPATGLTGGGGEASLT